MWRPARWQRPRLDEADPAERALQHWAQRIRAALRSELPSIGASQCTSPHRASGDEYAGRNSWHCTWEGRDFWCALDEPSERALLTLIIGERNSAPPTTLERQIVDELMCRVSGSHEERIQRELPSVDLWRCSILDTDSRWTLQLLTPCSRERTEDAPTAPIDMRPVPFQLDVLLPPTSIAFGEVLRWAPGDLCAFPRESKELKAIVTLQGRRLASGTVGSIAEQRLLRVDALFRVARSS